MIRLAKRGNAKPLIGLYARSGCGKTYSALLLARGCVGPAGKLGMIETENGRGEAFAGKPEIGDYSVWSLRDNFAPSRYLEAIRSFEQAKVDALIIDSASHEWEGTGGVLDQASERAKNGAKAILAWQQPKMDHQRFFMLPLMQSSIPLVICNMRAKYPMEERPKANGNGKEWVRSDILEPKQSEDILYEMFVHGWIDEQHRFNGTKYTDDSLRAVIRAGEPISAESGRRLAAWMKEQGAGTTISPEGVKPTSEGNQEASGADGAHDAPGETWPTFGRMSEFVQWSRETLPTMPPERATAWEEHFRAAIGKLASSANEASQTAASELMELYDAATMQKAA